MQIDIYQVPLSLSLVVKSAHSPKKKKKKKREKEKKKKPLIWKISFVLFVKIFGTLNGILNIPLDRLGCSISWNTF